MTCTALHYAQLSPAELRHREDRYEAYYLSGHVVEQAYRAVRRWLDFEPKTLVDLGTGGGTFGQRAPLVWTGIHRVGCEIRPEMAVFKTGRPRAARHYERFSIGDYFTVDLGGRYDLVTSNCPFSRTSSTIERALQLLRPGGLFLLFARATWGFSSDALTYLAQRTPSHSWPIPGRISLRRGVGRTGRPLGGDIVGHVWWLFIKGRTANKVLEWNTRLLPPLPSQYLSWIEVPGDESSIDPLSEEFWP